MFSKILTSTFLCFASLTSVSSTAFAEVRTVKGDGIVGLYTQTKTSDWGAVLDQLVSAYGAEIKTIDFSQMRTAKQGAFLVNVPSGAIFMLADEPVNPSLMSVMVATFPELGEQDLTDYTNGLVVAMQQTDSGFQLDGSVFKSDDKVKKATASGFKIGDQFINMPTGAELVMQNSRNQGGIKIGSFNFILEQDQATAERFIKAQLDASGLTYHHANLNQSSRFMIGEKGKPPSNIMITTTDDKAKAVLSAMVISVDN